MTQFVSFSIHRRTRTRYWKARQDKAPRQPVPGRRAECWVNVMGGDGGFNAISAAKGTDWFTANPDLPPDLPLSINYCNLGINCSNNSFSKWFERTSRERLMALFYFPYMLDSQAATQLIVGTCRVWRGGPATSASGTYAALSNNFETARADPAAPAMEMKSTRCDRWPRADPRMAMVFRR